MFDSVEKRRRVYSVLGWCTTVLLITLGCAFIVSCIGIYIQGDNPFTRESIGRALIRMIIPCIVTVVFIFVGAVLRFLYPLPDEKLAAVNSEELMIKKLVRKRSFSSMPQDTARLVRRARLSRTVSLALNYIFFIAGLVIGIGYTLSPDTLTDDLNKSVIVATFCVAVSLAPSLFYYVVTRLTDRVSMKREIELLKSAPTSEKSECEKINPVISFARRNRSEILIGVRIAIVIAAGVYITLGVINGGMKDVLDKAIKICTECIGLG